MDFRLKEPALKARIIITNPSYILHVKMILNLLLMRKNFALNNISNQFNKDVTVVLHTYMQYNLQNFYIYPKTLIGLKL